MLDEDYDFTDDDFEPDCDDEIEQTCPECGGTGNVPDNGTNMGECETCCGTGVYE